MSTKNKAEWLSRDKEPDIYDYILTKRRHFTNGNPLYLWGGFEYWSQYIKIHNRRVRERESIYCKFWSENANVIPVKFSSKMYMMKS